MPLSAAGRSERAKIAAYAKWAREPDRLAATAAGRNAAFEKHLNEVDPHHTLSEAQRYRMARAAQNEHLARMRLKALKKREASGVAHSAGGPEDPPTPPPEPRQGTAQPQGGHPDHIEPSDITATPTHGNGEAS
jgi:hypothetical protein